MTSTQELAPPAFEPLPRQAGLRERASALVPASAAAWALLGVIVVAVVVRILTIDNQSLWMDESLTAYEASLPFGAMLRTVAHVETTPPLFFVLVWLWTKVFGTGAIALRSISAISGVALVPLAYAAGRRLFSRWAGVLAGAFVAINPFLIWYSQEARAYMLLAALTAAGFLWFLRALELPSRKNLAWWAVFSALALMTHFFAGFIVAPEALWLLWRHRNRAVLLAVGVSVVVQAAMLPFVVIDTNAAHGTSWIAHVPRLHRVTTAALEYGVSLLNRRGNTLIAFIGWAVLCSLVLFMVLFSGQRRVRWGALVAGSVAAFVILAPIVVAFAGQDYFLTRNVIAAFVPLAVLVAGACTARRALIPGTALSVALLAMFAWATVTVQTTVQLERPNWKALASKLGAAPVPRAVIVARGTTADPLKIYLPGVSWVQPQHRRTELREIDVVGNLKPVPVGTTQAADAGPTATAKRKHVHDVPVDHPPRWARLITRFRYRSWVVARYALVYPRRLNVVRLVQLSRHLFRHTPQTMLVFMQRPTR